MTPIGSARAWDLARALFAFSLSILLLTASAAAEGKGKNGKDDDDKPLPKVAEKISGMEERAGFLTFYADKKTGRIWLELAPPQADGLVAEVIYMHGFRQGLGSNPVGLDRGRMEQSGILRIRRLGARVLFEQQNYDYRALSENPEERLATRQSFATSVIWGEKIGALDDDGRALVDLSSFVLADVNDVATTLKGTGQGKYELDPDRSAVDLAACLAFPDNVEFEGLVTWKGEEPGPHVTSTTPTADSVTLVMHHSLVRLPDDGYRPRRHDPRVGMIPISFLDYAVPLDQSMQRKWVLRHRLEKVDPTAARSRVKEPIVYYLDRGAPEPVKSALLDGARWWAEAFEQAGFINAFKVEVLPEDAHPLDVRYNMIHWVHRSTRGWSYGFGINDPRTGEIIKGNVLLGSLRVRQDRLIFEGLLGTEKTGTGSSDDPVEIALARIRQLSAHEVGHTLGLTHNFAASTYDGRASVMDYPAPLIEMADDGGFDLSKAYGVGIGTWDAFCIRYGYAQFAPGADEEAELERIVREGLERHTFVTDADARPPGASDARGNLWDNGTDPVDELAKLLEIRRRALDRLGERNLPPGRPIAELEEVLAPLYFHHRYQLDAAAKVLGGFEYNYAVNGDGQTATRIVDGGEQRRALEGLLAILEPAVLDLPDSVLERLPARPFGYRANREMFTTTTWPAFDALGAAATAADDVVEALTEPSRLGRLVDFHRRRVALPAAGEVLEALVGAAFEPAEDSLRHAALRRIVQRVVVDRLIDRAAHPDLRGDLRGEIEWTLAKDVGPRLEALASSGARETAAHAAALAMEIKRFLERDRTAPEEFSLPSDPPPGSPIGASHLMGCGVMP